MKHNRSKNAVLLMIIFICSICSNNVWARETGAMDQLEKENLDDVDKMNKGRVKKREFFSCVLLLMIIIIVILHKKGHNSPSPIRMLL